jgi:hypothetical protein
LLLPSSPHSPSPPSSSSATSLPSPPLVPALLFHWTGCCCISLMPLLVHVIVVVLALLLRIRSFAEIVGSTLLEVIVATAAIPNVLAMGQGGEELQPS